MRRDPMNHRLAVGFLPDFVANQLEERTASATREHIEQCPECREWVGTYRLFEQTLGVERSQGEHPDSNLIALCVLRPEETFELDREGLLEHLQVCGSCQEEVEILREAVQGARPRHGTESKPPARLWKERRRGVPPLRWGLLAAGLTALAVGMAVYFTPRADLRSPRAELSREVGGVEGEDTEELSNLELEDERLIETDRRRLMVTHVKVKSGARITFRAGERAAFGDGFQISDGGAVIVEVRTPPSQVTKGRGGS